MWTADQIWVLASQETNQEPEAEVTVGFPPMLWRFCILE